MKLTDSFSAMFTRLRVAFGLGFTSLRTVGRGSDLHCLSGTFRSQLACSVLFATAISAAYADQIGLPILTASGNILNSTYVRQAKVAISSPTAGAEIHYTLNGIDPTLSDPVLAPGMVLPIRYTATLKAKAFPVVGTFSEGKTPSEVASGSYTVAPRQVAAGVTNSFSILRGRSAVGWGKNYEGSLSVGDTLPRNQWDILKMAASVPLTGVTDITGGDTHALGIIGGQVYAWGLNNVGQLGANKASNQLARSVFPVPVVKSTGPLAGVITVSAGHTYSLALDSAGNVWSWGTGYRGLLGDGNYQSHNRIYADTVKVSASVPLSNIVEISAGHDHALALDRNGNVWAWGMNTYGQLGQNNAALTVSPYAVRVKKDATNFLTGVKSISAGMYSSFAVLDENGAAGVVKAWGFSNYGRLGDGSTLSSSGISQTPSRLLPVSVLTSPGTVVSGVSHVSAGKGTSAATPSTYAYTLFHKSDGGLLMSGYTGYWKQSVAGKYKSYVDSVCSSNNLPLTGIIDVAAGATHWIAVGSNGAVYTAGTNTDAVGDPGRTPVGASAYPSSSIALPNALNTPARVVMSTSGAPYTAPAVVSMTATAVDPDGSVQKVEYYAEDASGRKLLSTSTSVPYAFSWTNVPFSTSVLTAVATDNTGAITTSAPVTVVVNAPFQFVDGSRFARGFASYYDYMSFVVPLDFEAGQGLEAMGKNSAIYGTVDAKLPWFMRVAKTTAYHISVNGTSITYPTTNPSGSFENPIVAFGASSGKASMYTGQSYSFGLHAGSGAPAKLRIRWYQKTALDAGQSNVAATGSAEISLPQKGSSGWDTFSANGFVYTDTSVPGLETKVRFVEGATYADKWGTQAVSPLSIPLILTHTCSDSNYYYQVDFKGKVWLPGESTASGGYWMAVNNPAAPGDATAAYSLGYTMDFQVMPAWRSTFVSAPQFTGSPVPSAYYGKSLEELLKATPPVGKQFPQPSSPAAFLQIGSSTELQQHPLLDKFVVDMGSDPLALVNYVLNEVELTDAISWNDQGGLEETSINAGGVNRGALATFLEGQGSPAEQCALTVYLLRKVGVPAAYVFPSHNSMQMLDSQMSKLLRMQLHNAQQVNGTSNVPHVLPVNYPWVAAWIASENRWVHIFPWIKDTDIKEGRDFYSYLPAGYKNGSQWLRKYIAKDSTGSHPIFPTVASGLEIFGNGKDTPGAVFLPWLESVLRKTHPEITLGDLGTIAYNRRNNFTRWDDMPRPWSVSESTGSMKLYSDFGAPYADGIKLFDTVQIIVYKDANGDGVVDPAVDFELINTDEIESVNFHNRRVVLSTGVPTAGQWPLTLSIASPVAPDPADPNWDSYTWSWPAYRYLTDADDKLLVQVVYKRHKTLKNINMANGSFLSVVDTPTVSDIRPFRKGDLVALCFNFGRVTRSMLNVHANELWAHQEYLKKNPAAVGRPDVFVGGPAYLMGMSYYEKVSRFQDIIGPLHKVHTLSWAAHGTSRVSPDRTAGGQPLIVDGQISLTRPNVDMSFQRLAWAGNGSLRPDSGMPNNLANGDFFQMLVGQTSAQEHESIDTFYDKAGSASTVKLLHLSLTQYGKFVELTKNNYLAEGDKKYPAGGAMTLRQLAGYNAANPTAPSMWKTIVDGFTADWEGNYQQVFVPAGLITSGNFTGFGALILKTSSQAALISSMNGGFAAEKVSLWTYSTPAQYTNNTLSVSNDGQMSYTSMPTLTAPASVPFSFNIPEQNWSVGLSIATSPAAAYDPHTTSLLNSVRATSIKPATFSNGDTVKLTLGAGVILATTDKPTGASGQTITPTGTSYNGGVTLAAIQGKPSPFGSAVSDPVSAITGEFYTDDIDITLSGPMPLQVRRNYSSVNIAAGDFGWGWKISFVPYMTASQEGNNEMLYAAEVDGSVIGYRRVKNAQGAFTNSWTVRIADNPQIANLRGDEAGSVFNPLNARIDSSVVNGVTVYTLVGVDNSRRVYKVRSFAIDGISRERAYLDSWTDHRGVDGVSGNKFTFQFYGDGAGESALTVGYGHLKKITASNGNCLNFTYDSTGRILDVFTGDGRHVRYEYDGAGDLVKVVRPDASEIRYEYLYAPVTVAGKTTMVSQHLIKREIKPDGRVLENDYDDPLTSRRVIRQRASVGPNNELMQNAAFVYSTTVNAIDKTISGNTTATITVNGVPATTRYDIAGSQITKITDPLGQTLTQEWYTAAEVAAYGNPNPYIGPYVRSVKRRVDKRGLVTELKYDSIGNVVEKKVSGDLKGAGTADVAITKYSYNSARLLESETDPLLNVTRYTYGDTAHPNLVTLVEKRSSTGALISSVSKTYEDVGASYGLLKTSTAAPNTTDAASVTWTNDSRGFVIGGVWATGTTDPSVTKSFRYNLRGELEEEKDAAGRATRYAYDGLGKRIWQERRDTAGTMVSWQYDYYNRNGELEWSDGPRYNPEDYVLRRYDGAGRVKEVLVWRTAALNDGSGVGVPPNVDDALATTINKYDIFGNLIEVIDARHNSTEMTYDGIGQMRTRKAHAGDKTTAVLAEESWTYEKGGQVATYTNPVNGVTKKFYTDAGKLRRQENPDGSVQEWRYGLDGRVSSEVLTNGSHWDTVYDDTARTVTRTLYSKGNAVLASQSTVMDRRGNVVASTDAEGNAFSSSYDALNRVKSSSGPATTTSAAQQIQSVRYDAAGITKVETNALGEATVTTSDALGRPISVEILNAGTVSVRKSSFSYSSDGHSVTETRGTGSTAVVTTTFTDTTAKPVLIRHADGTFAATQYDNLGNVVLTQDENQNQTSNVYDALNRLSLQTLSGGAATSFKYDAAGNLLERLMPGNQKQVMTYDAALRKLSEELRGTQPMQASGTPTVSGTTRRFDFTYYAAPSAFVGRLKTTKDALGVETTATYDDFLRLLNVTTTGPGETYGVLSQYGYDRLSRLTNVAQSYTTASMAALFPSTSVDRTYTGYGQIKTEKVTVGGVVTSDFNQVWDGAGRRVSLNSVLPTQGTGAGREAQFAYRADGLMSQVSAGGSNFGFTYGDNGLLGARNNALRTQQITDRDSLGRVLNTKTMVGGSTVMVEAQSWFARSQRASYLAQRTGAGTWNDNRTYSYTGRGPLIAETATSAPGQNGMFEYRFDFESLDVGSPSASGLGVRTAAQWSLANPYTFEVGSWLTYDPSLLGTTVNRGVDAFERPTFELQVATTPNMVNGVYSAYDAVGQLGWRNFWTEGVGSQNRQEGMVWDGVGRLVQVQEGGLDFNNGTYNWQNGFLWRAVYDGLGRRVRTTKQAIVNWGLSGAVQTIDTQFDPQVEFLEVGVSVNGARTWEVHGPDLNGVYGGLQGIGGLEATVDESTGTVTPVVNNTFGDVVGRVVGTGMVWHGAQSGSYGVLPGSTATVLGSGVSVAETLAWRSRRMDATGLIYMGARYYEPKSGRFISTDPLGHGSSMSLYDYCNGDPVNFVDPDGRCKAGGPPLQLRGMDYDTEIRLGGVLKTVGGGAGLAGSLFSIGITEGVATPLAGPAAIGFADLTSRGLYETITGRPTTSLSERMFANGGDSFGVAATDFSLDTSMVGSGVKDLVKIQSIFSKTGGAIEVTPQSIAKSLEGSSMMTPQGVVSLPAVERYVRMLEQGRVPPAIIVDGKAIVEGNHRYIAGRVFGTEPPTTPGTLAPSQASRLQSIQKTVVDPTDWGNH